MANTTNFNWETPDDTDLVKDGAAAMRTLGNSIDTSFVDLKGGTTGQLLAKASGTDLDYTWTTPAVGSTYVAGKNAFYNAAFDIWQRGTSFIGTAYNYTADRWLGFRGAFAAGATFTRATSTQAGFQYALKCQRDSGNTGTDVLHLRQGLETIDSLRFAGQTVTLSFYAKAGANFSPTSSILVSTVYQGEGTDQATNNMTGWTGVTANAQNNTLTTSWQRFTQTVSVSSAKTQIGVGFTYTPTGTAGADDSYQITGVQIEIASTASAFSRQTGSIALELEACQRYYWIFRRDTAQFGLMGNTGYASTAAIARFALTLPVSLRTTPTAIDTANIAANRALTDTRYSSGTWAIVGTSSAYNNSVVEVSYTHGSGVFTAGDVVNIQSTSATNQFIGLSAEL